MANRKQRAGVAIPSASPEHCFYCFDALIVHLKDKDTELPAAAFPNADTQDITVCVGWSDSTSIRGTCISFHEDESLEYQLEDLAVKSGRSIHTPTEVQNLTCTVYFVDRSTIAHAKDLDDWDIGKHGIYVQFADPRTNKQFSKSYLPATITKRGWSKKEAVENAIRRSGYDGPTTKELLATIKLARFSVHSSATATFADYRANFIASVRSERAATATNAANGNHKERLELRAKLHDFLDQEKARKVKLKDKREGSRKFSYMIGGLFAVVLVGLVVLLRYQQTYSVFYEEFLENYDVLGVPREAPLADVKKAHRDLSLKWHPDKNPGCAECGPKYARIAEAYRQITDREKGTLKFKDQPKGRSEFKTN